jgi:azurin
MRARDLFSASILSVSLLLPLGTTVTAAGAAAGRTVAITAADDMKYSVTKIDAKPGEQLTVTLKATGTMPRAAMAHNFVLLKAGVDPTAFTNAGAGAAATNFIAPANQAQVLASTKLAGNGETVEVSFKAPAKPGSYTYLCTFPGHFVSGMKGVLVVK